MSGGADLRRVLERYWAELDLTLLGPGAALKTSPLPVATEHGPVSAATDGNSLRHLLIPLRGRRRIPTGRIGGTLRVTERALEDDETYGRFADIVCSRRDLDDVFTGLCADVLVALEADGRHPYRTTLAVVNRWRKLFSGVSPTFSEAQEIGLAGELSVLLRLLEKDPDAVRLWTGPEGACHDFSDGLHAVEVKSTLTTSERRTFDVHGLDQLEAPQGGRLVLVWHRFERSPRGRTVGELAAAAARMCVDDSELWLRLARVGYQRGQADDEVALRVTPVEERWYEVDEVFPRLTTASLREPVPDGLLDVRYTVDLAGVHAPTLDVSAVDAYLGELGRTP
ncbi:PD-(D/E)XK motif protein [Streptomyces somaliensis]|uniref:PD-(D/E)XK motif protein n=1 Tax=Streptomyces somaliensis TaxID=78355 RepID=UPI0034E935B1|nr:PD-(D/E)XK motif protein [Streptomyces somaliensis]MCP9974352.1 PD-(D/E)XK motif protein [Streptomyces somaliensis]